MSKLFEDLLFASRTFDAELYKHSKKLRDLFEQKPMLTLKLEADFAELERKIIAITRAKRK